MVKYHCSVHFILLYQRKGGHSGWEANISKNTISTTRESQVFKLQACVQIDRKGQSFPKAPILLYSTLTCNPPECEKNVFWGENASPRSGHHWTG